MRFTLLAVVIGLCAGVACGGRPRFLAGRRLRAWPLLAGGVVLQLAAARIDGGGGTIVLAASFGCLLAFAVANMAIVGMWLVATGIGLNVVVIGLNGGMPVRPTALVAAGLAAPGGEADVRLGTKHHLERPSDRLVGLGDIVPVRPLREVLSFGDLVAAVGAADVAAHLLAPAGGRRVRKAGDPNRVGAARTSG